MLLLNVTLAVALDVGLDVALDAAYDDAGVACVDANCKAIAAAKRSFLSMMTASD